MIVRTLHGKPVVLVHEVPRGVIWMNADTWDEFLEMGLKQVATLDSSRPVDVIFGSVDTENNVFTK